MAPQHAAQIENIQRSIYPPSLHEATALILERAAAFPAGSAVALDAAGAVLAYISAYPYPHAEALAAPPSLGRASAASIARALAAPAEACLFLHEVSVYNQGAGLGTQLVRHVLAAARALGLRRCVLVSVLGNRAFYEKVFGFATLRELPEPYSCAEAARLEPAPPPLPPTPSYFCTDTAAHVMELAW